MDKKILERASYDTDNAKLEAAIADYTASNNDIRKLEGLIKIFKGAQVLVPVAFPKQVKVTVLEKMLRGEPLGKDESFPLFPITMSDQKGNKFAPAFTSRDKVLETKEFPYMIRVPAEQVIRNALNEKMNLGGVLLNPQTGGFVFRRQAFLTDFSKIPTDPQKRQVKKVSRDEFIILARSSVEKNQIPRALFEQKGEFVRRLEEERETFVCGLYGKPYGDKVPSPYRPEDFSVMPLDIDEDTTAVCIELPGSHVVPHIATSAYVVWNPKTEEAWYYMIEKGAAGESDVLCNVTPEGKHQELMTSPPVGSELTAVLDLIREEKEEAE